MGVDQSVSETLHEWVRDHPLVVDVLRFVTSLGRPQTLVAGAVVLAFAFLVRGRARISVYLVVATLGAWLLDIGLKDVFDRARPELGEPLARSSGASFPSGHAMTSAAAYTAVAIVWRRAWVSAVCAGLVIAISFTRVALGVHWMTDVVAGMVLGAGWAWGCARVLRRGPQDLHP